jgi:hypothetical protein
MQNSLLNSYLVANLKSCFNIVRGHDEKTATKPPFKLMGDGNFQFFLAQAAAILKHENAMKSLSNNVGVRASHMFQSFHWRFTAHSYRRPDSTCGTPLLM